MSLILASTSVHRQKLLQGLGFKFQCFAPAVDEKPLQADLLRQGGSPQKVAEALAALKGQSVLSQNSKATVISADQLVSIDQLILGKTQSPAQALDQLLLLNGRSHHLITSVCLFHQGAHYQHTDISTLKMKTLSRQELANYIQLDQTMDCAGSYKIESRGLVLFEKIQCEDFSAIQGLPMVWLTNKLKELGYEFFKN